MSYATALYVKKTQNLEPKPVDYYDGLTAIEYDVELFIEKLNNEEEVESNKIFFEKIRQKEKEWAERDLVLDPNETWNEWFKRNLEFEEPPMVPRDEIPEEKQPHNSLYGRLSSYMSGINPYPPGHMYNSDRPKRRHHRDIEQQDNQIEDEKEEGKHFEENEDKPSEEDKASEHDCSQIIIKSEKAEQMSKILFHIQTVNTHI